MEYTEKLFNRSVCKQTYIYICILITCDSACLCKIYVKFKFLRFLAEYLMIERSSRKLLQITSSKANLLYATYVRGYVSETQLLFFLPMIPWASHYLNTLKKPVNMLSTPCMYLFQVLFSIYSSWETQETSSLYIMVISLHMKVISFTPHESSVNTI